MSMAEIHAAVIVRERRSCELQTAVFYASSFMNSKTPSALSRCWWALWLINMFFGLEAVASGLVSVQRLSSHLRPVALTENNRIQTHTRAVIIWPFWAGCMINCLLGHLILTPGAGGGGRKGSPLSIFETRPAPLGFIIHRKWSLPMQYPRTSSSSWRHHTFRHFSLSSCVSCPTVSTSECIPSLILRSVFSNPVWAPLFFSGVGVSGTKRSQNHTSSPAFSFPLRSSPGDGYVLENRYEVVAKNRMASQQRGLYIIVNNSPKWS